MIYRVSVLSISFLVLPLISNCAGLFLSLSSANLKNRIQVVFYQMSMKNNVCHVLYNVIIIYHTLNYIVYRGSWYSFNSFDTIWHCLYCFLFCFIIFFFCFKWKTISFKTTSFLHTNMLINIIVWNWNFNFKIKNESMFEKKYTTLFHGFRQATTGTSVLYYLCYYTLWK